jgi:hypothetical protein
MENLIEINSVKIDTTLPIPKRKIKFAKDIVNPHHFLCNDVSRFGRNQTMVGYYIDLIFPKYDVEFISVSEQDKDYIPLHNFVNELYAKENSKKIRAVLKHKGLSGKRITTTCPYGYKKVFDENGNENWEIDEAAAEIVRKIYDLYINKRYGVCVIANYLTKQQILKPTAHKGHKCNTGKFNWNPRTVGGILRNQVYCGDTVNFKSYNKSFKDKKRIYKPPSEHTIFYDTQEPIISRETYEKAVELYSKRRRCIRHEEKSVLRGLLYCKDCNSDLVIARSHKCNAFICHKYTHSVGKECSTHFIREDYLLEFVNQKIEALIDMRDNNSELLYKKISKNVSDNLKTSQSYLTKRISEIERELLTAKSWLKNIYIEKENGEISREVFAELAEQFNTDIQRLKHEQTELSMQQNKSKQEQKNVKKFYKALESLEKLCYNKEDSNVLENIIDKIVVSERAVKRSQTQPDVKIYFKGVGYLDFI